MITAIIICLGDKNHEADSGILRLLEVLLSSERDVEEKRHILQHDYDIPMTERIESEVSEMCNLSEGIEQRGIQKERLNSIQNLMKNLKLPMEQAMAALGIPKDEWETYRSLRNDIKQN